MFVDLTEVSKCLEHLDHTIIRTVMCSIYDHKPFPAIRSPIDRLTVNKDRNCILVLGEIKIVVDFYMHDQVLLMYKNMLLEINRDFLSTCSYGFPISLADNSYCSIIATNTTTNQVYSVKSGNFHTNEIDMTQSALQGDQVGLLNGIPVVHKLAHIAMSLPALFMPCYNFRTGNISYGECSTTDSDEKKG